jgi:pimeloyl-ACP methyl ester carboxylesterase
MPREIRFADRSLIDGLLEIYHSSRFLAVCSFLLIIFISSAIPLSIIWLIQTLFLDISIIPISSPYLSVFFTIWSLAEIIFLIYQSYLYSIIQHKAPVPHLTSIERDEIVTNALSNIKNLENTLSKWFMDRPFESINRPSIIGWLAFAFYSKTSQDLNDNEYQEIKSLIHKIEIEHKLKVTGDETNNKISYMKHILDPVRIIFRPLAFYIVTDTLLNGILSNSIFHLRGYHFVQIGHLSFWTYHDETSDTDEEEEDPIIFFHGIGAGHLMYQPFIGRIHKQFSRRRRIILISMRCICMRYPSLKDIPNMSQTVESIQLIFNYYKLKKAIFIGHRLVYLLNLIILHLILFSYGTACLSWIVKKCPEYISRLIFLDPICFALFEPYVIYNFVYRMPYKLGHLYMYYFVCRELGISYMISRHFWWTQNNLFIKQIPSHSNKILPTYVLLSGRDCIVNVHLVKDYLIDNKIDYYWAPNLSHGGYMQDKKSWEQICQWIS